MNDKKSDKKTDGVLYLYDRAANLYDGLRDKLTHLRDGVADIYNRARDPYDPLKGEIKTWIVLAGFALYCVVGFSFLMYEARKQDKAAKELCSEVSEALDVEIDKKTCKEISAFSKAKDKEKEAAKRVAERLDIRDYKKVSKTIAQKLKERNKQKQRRKDVKGIQLRKK